MEWKGGEEKKNDWCVKHKTKIFFPRGLKPFVDFLHALKMMMPLVVGGSIQSAQLSEKIYTKISSPEVVGFDLETPQQIKIARAEIKKWARCFENDTTDLILVPKKALPTARTILEEIILYEVECQDLPFGHAQTAKSHIQKGAVIYRAAFDLQLQMSKVADRVDQALEVERRRLCGEGDDENGEEHNGSGPSSEVASLGGENGTKRKYQSCYFDSDDEDDEAFLKAAEQAERALAEETEEGEVAKRGEVTDDYIPVVVTAFPHKRSKALGAMKRK
jgi:hypothetical protein